jgi:hypothetical protein
VDGAPVRLDDVVSGFRTVHAGATDDTIRITTAEGDRTFAECGGSSASGWLRRHGVVAAFVRPDHYVYATGTAPDDAAQALPTISLATGEYR